MKSPGLPKNFKAGLSGRESNQSKFSWATLVRINFRDARAPFQY